MARDWRLSWSLLTSLAPAVEVKAEVAWGKLCRSLCALPNVAKSMMQLTGASQRQHGPYLSQVEEAKHTCELQN
jgi:hypothetical protein